MAAFLGQDLATGTWLIQEDVRYDPRWRQRYQDYYAARNVWLAYRRDLLSPGTVASTQQICPESTLVASEYYNDFLRPQGLRHGLRGVIAGQGLSRGIITALRGPRHGAFDVAQQRLLTSLLPHLQRVMRIHQRLQGALAVPNAALSALDDLTAGVIFLGGAGEVAFMNRAASQIAGKEDGLRISHRWLCAVDDRDDKVLQKAIRCAIFAADGGPPVQGQSLRVSRSSDDMPLSVVVAPLANQPSPQIEGRVSAIVFVGDPLPRRHHVAVERLQELFGLTAAEAAVSAAIVEGLTLRDVARERQVSIHTARTQLKTVFQKVGARGQVELVRLVLNSAAAIPLERGPRPAPKDE